MHSKERLNDLESVCVMHLVVKGCYDASSKQEMLALFSSTSQANGRSALKFWMPRSSLPTNAMLRYLGKLVRATPIESNWCIKQLADHMNAEVVGGTVTNICEAIEWIRCTYLHVWMCKHPLPYGISAVGQDSNSTLRQPSRELSIEAAELLDEREMARCNPDSGNLTVCNLGRVASPFHIRNQSVANLP